MTWYTWLEQGRDIGVSAAFLDSLSRALKLDATERRHLFLLAHQRLPPEPGKTWCIVPSIIHRLMDDLVARPAYVMNLRWDVLAFNFAADRVFRFSSQPRERRNLLWMLFTDARMRRLFDPWEEQALNVLSSFRRDFARATEDSDMATLVKDLRKIDPDFKAWWPSQTIHAPCHGVRHIFLQDIGRIDFEHTTLIVDEDRHLRLIYYTTKADEPASEVFERWLQDDGERSTRPAGC